MSLKTLLTCDQCDAPIAMLEEAPKDLELLATCWACATKKTSAPHVEALKSHNGANGTPKVEPSPAISLSSARLDELRDIHGPVFRIMPKGPVEAGQELTNADGTKLEMIEPDTLPDESGEIKQNRWFAKQTL